MSKRQKKLPAAIRFWRMVVGADGKPNPKLCDCWLWTGTHKRSKRKYGESVSSYPMFSEDSANKIASTHAIHFAFNYFRGEERPKRGSGLELSHTCKTGALCVNPWHVVVEPHKKNMHRSIAVVRLSAANARTYYMLAHAPGPAKCHPDCKRHARQLCQSCYQNLPDVHAKRLANQRGYYAASKLAKQKTFLK